MPIRDLNFSVWFSIFEYIPIEDVCRFGLSCKLAHVLFHRQRHVVIRTTQATAMACQENSRDERIQNIAPRSMN